MLDIAWVFAGIPLGICESVKDAALFPIHLPQIIKGLGQALYFVIETIELNDPENLQYGGPPVWELRDKRNKLIKQGIMNIAQAIEDSSWHDRVKGCTRLIADIWIPGKVFSAYGHLFAGVVSQSKGLRRLEGVASMLDEELGFEKVVQDLVQRTKQLEVTTPEGFKGQLLVECMNAESNFVDKSKKSIKAGSSTAVILTEYPNGKYVNNPKHHMNSKGSISKPPINGQKALNESLAVPNQKYRVCIQDEKFVILREHSQGEWHGYMIENYKSLRAHERNAFYDTGLIDSVKSGKIIK